MKFEFSFSSMIARFWLPFFFCVLCTLTSSAQEVSQNIRGKVEENETKQPIIGAHVAVYEDSTLLKGSTTDTSGRYQIEEVPVGRYTIVVSNLGYKKRVLPNVVVNSGKEKILNVSMEESVEEIDEVEVTAKQKGEPENEMATISARTFSVEETERYAGSRGDPARMASNFAGVQGADDSRNDIVIRGNTPLGIVFRLENTNIPNPNHFGVSGTQGGPVGLLNNKVLSNSDFFTGAFPAEFGNGIAGVFDLDMRNGNNEQYEFTGEFGLFGAEAQAEGPFSKNGNSSFLVNYRYGTLRIMQAINIDLGTSAVPRYQDMHYKLNFPLQNGANLSMFGLGGISRINLLSSDASKPSERELYSAQGTDERFRTRMGATGLNYTQPFSDQTFGRFTLAASQSMQKNDVDRVYRHITRPDSTYVIDSLVDKIDYRFIQNKYSFNFYINHKANARHTIKAGMYTDAYHYNFTDSIYNQNGNYRTKIRTDYQGVDMLLQPFVQWKYKPLPILTLTAGLHGQYFSLNNSYAIEPRAGIDWQFAENQSLSFGFGMHSQMQPTYIYFQRQYNADGSYRLHNKDLGFTRSNHYVLGYDLSIGRNLHLKAETYYQKIYDLPVEQEPSSYSIINEGNTFDRFFPKELPNEGTGRNYGLEVTLEKFFSKTFFYMFTGSVYDATYVASNGNRYNSDFNGNYMLNLLGTKEFKWGAENKHTVGIGGKVTWGGGKRYTPVDSAASEAAGEFIGIDSLRNSEQFKDYFRADLKLNYKLNTKKLTHELGVDLVNVFDIQNILRLQYVGGDQQVRKVNQLGFMPIFYYRVDF